MPPPHPLPLPVSASPNFTCSTSGRPSKAQPPPGHLRGTWAPSWPPIPRQSEPHGAGGSGCSSEPAPTFGERRSEHGRSSAHGGPAGADIVPSGLGGVAAAEKLSGESGRRAGRGAAGASSAAAFCPLCAPRPPPSAFGRLPPAQAGSGAAPRPCCLKLVKLVG